MPRILLRTSPILNITHAKYKAKAMLKQKKDMERNLYILIDKDLWIAIEESLSFAKNPAINLDVALQNLHIIYNRANGLYFSVACVFNKTYNKIVIVYIKIMACYSW